VLSDKTFWIGVVVGVAATFAYHKMKSGGLGPPKA
jgi:hypothetical protein